VQGAPDCAVTLPRYRVSPAAAAPTLSASFVAALTRQEGALQAAFSLIASVLALQCEDTRPRLLPLVTTTERYR
jgi:hypothetical protein